MENSVPYEIIIVHYGFTEDDDLTPLLSDSSVPLTYIKCHNLEIFRLSHARNIGAKSARGDWIFYVDIDTCLTTDMFVEIEQYITDTTKYYAAVDSQIRKEIINGGLIIVPKFVHDFICGFNEKLTGWGFEDIDYKQRLEKLGKLTFKEIYPHLYTCVDHDDLERTQCYSVEKDISWTKNRQLALETWNSPDHGIWTNSDVSTFGYN